VLDSCSQKEKTNGAVSFRFLYKSLIALQVKEVALANLFMPCGKIVDCRLCCDPNSALRFAFIELDSEAAVDQVIHPDAVRLQEVCCLQ
jgi:RNA recognition motif. (a.k.a. RRM, RBD, or RNP domain)